MAEVVKYRFVLRRGLAADWVAKNEVLLQGEFGLELDTGLGKIGDGSTPWNSLLYTIVGQVDLTGLANGKCLAWDSVAQNWYVASRGVAYYAGDGIGIDDSNPEAPIISSTLGSISLSGRVATYSALPSGLGGGDAGKAYWVDADRLVYIWNGSAFPAEGDGVEFTTPESGTLYSYTEPPFSNVSTLMHFDGLDGSTSIVDQVSGNTWVAQGGAELDTSWSAYGPSSLLVPGGSNACISMPTSSKFDIGTGDWTIQFIYRYIGGTQASARVFHTRDGDVYTGLGLAMNTSGSEPSTIRLYMSSSTSSFNMVNGVAMATLSQTDPTEMLVQRRGSVVEWFINGVFTGSTLVNNPGSPVYYNPSDTIIIGGNKTGTSRSIGAQLDEFRFVKGLALVTPNRGYPVTFPLPNS